MLKLALIGDLHLSERSPRFTHVLDTLDAAIADAVGQGVTGFCFLGDLVEGRPSPREVWSLGVRFRYIAEHGGWVAVVQGNHEDAETGMLWEALGVRRSAWNDFQAIHDEATILCVPYPRRGRPPFEALEDDGTVKGSMSAAAERIAARIMDECKATAHVDGQLVDAAPTPVIVLGHFTIEGLTTRDADFELHTATEVVVPRAAFADVALCAVGHIHRAQDYIPGIGWGLNGGEPETPRGTIVGAGSLIRHSFGEAEDPKSYTLVTVDGGRVNWERRPVPAREMRVERFAWRHDMSRDAVADDVNQVGGYWGKEVKLIVEIREDQLATYDPAIFDPIKEAAAHFVIEKEVVTIERVRAPAIAAATTPAAQLTAWLESIAYEGGEADRATLAAMLAEVTS